VFGKKNCAEGMAHVIRRYAGFRLCCSSLRA